MYQLALQLFDLIKVLGSILYLFSGMCQIAGDSAAIITTIVIILSKCYGL